MTKTELIVLMAQKADVTQRIAESCLDSFVEVVIETLSKRNEKVLVAGLGVFEVRDRKERTGRDPRTKEFCIIQAQKSPAFKASKQLKEAVKS
jgi:DNA-binding protein HU-beta